MTLWQVALGMALITCVISPFSAAMVCGRLVQGVQAHVLLAVFFVTLELTALYFILISNFVPYIMQF